MRRLFCNTSQINKKHVGFRRSFDKTQYLNYNEFYKSFKWNIPKYFNIGFECSDYHVNIGNGDKTALIDHTSNKQYTFNDLTNLSNKLCLSLRDKFNIGNGDIVSILLPQSIETAISHLSIFKLGAISLPLFILFGNDALKYRLNDSKSKLIITNQQCLPKILQIKNELPHLENIIVVDGDDDNNLFKQIMNDNDNNVTFENIHDSLSDDGALIIYTSGTTGHPKGCLHGHRVLLGHLPGIETPHNFLPQQDDIFWTPADWAWIGGLLDALLPSLYYGIPIIAYRPKKFDVYQAFDLMKQYNVTSTFLPPTALKMMKSVCDDDMNNNNNNNGNALKHKLRSIGSGGESVTDGLQEWALNTFDTKINEFYGQTECNLVVSNAFNVFEPKPGSMGRCVPGHIVEILDNDGNIINDENKTGNICIKSPDPVMFIKYLNNDKKTNEKFVTNKSDGSKWLMTGDIGYKTNDGYFYYESRDDDIINLRGYRVGPVPIEQAIMKHKNVINAAVIGCQDGNAIKAFVISSDKTDKVAKEIRDLVSKLEGHYVVPKFIEFVDELPMTITGKIQRNKLKA